MPQVKPEIETFAKIKVIGVGGGGGSAVHRMVNAGIRGVDFCVMNTDVQALHHNSAEQKLHIGKTITRGLGAGMDPEMGKKSAEEAQNEIREILQGTDMVFITCGLGGGTGSGAAPIIAEIAKEMGALTVAVVTKPFTFEGPQRSKIAGGAYDALSEHVDTIITIPNDRVLQIIDKKTPMLDAFKILDDVLRQGVQGISELITVPGLINVDFADVKTIMKEQGSALMGIGIASGENRAVDAAKAAISSPLLELSIEGARGILFTITGGTSLSMQEVSEAADIITGSADDDVRVIFGSVIDESMGDDLRVTVVATGFDENDDLPLLIKTAKDTIEDEYEEEEEDVPVFRKKPAVYTKPKFSRSPVEQKQKNTIIRDEAEEDLGDHGFVSKPITHTPAEYRDSTRKPSAAATSFEEEDEDDEEDLEIPAFIRKKMGL